MRIRPAIVVGLLAVLTSPATTQAQQVNWIDTAGGTFQDSSNWNPAAVPGPLDWTYFDLSSVGGYVVQFTGGHETAQCVIRDDVVVFDLGGFIYTLNEIGAPTESAVIGGSSGDGYLTILDGAVFAESTRIATSQSGTGSLTVHGPAATWIASGPITIGDNGLGFVSVVNGGVIMAADVTRLGLRGSGRGYLDVGGIGSQVTTNTLEVGLENIGRVTVSSWGRVDTTSDACVGCTAFADGFVTVVGLEANWTTGGNLLVGDAGEGNMSVLVGGHVKTTMNSVFGAQSGSIGDGLLGGNNTIWTSDGELIVGDAGTGSLTITSGASMVSEDSTYFGKAAGGVGNVQVLGTGTYLDAGFPDFHVGSSGSGSLLVGQGGLVSGNNMIVAALRGSVGTVSIVDPGSLIIGNDFVVGSGGTGSLLVANGGEVGNENGDLNIGVDGGGVGSMTVVGAGSLVNSDQVRIWGGSTALVGDQGSVLTDSAHVGFGAGLATATITGPGSSWAAANRFNVGVSGNGTVLVQNGGAGSSVGLTRVGRDGYTGTLTVTDPGSSWAASNHALSVGLFEGTGFVYIENGATVFADQSSSFGNGTNGYGEVAVCGAGSTLTMDERVDIGKTPATAQGILRVTDGANVVINGFAIVGFAAQGTLELTSGGSCLITGHMTIGSQVDSSGIVTVTGSGSTLDVGDYLSGGFAGPANVAISDGGRIDVTATTTMGVLASGVGNADVSGPTSVFSSGVQMIVGSLGQATLTLQDGGTASAPSIVIGAAGVATGNGLLDGDVQNDGVVAPGLSAGALTVDGTFTQGPGGSLSIQLGGLSPVTQHDQMIVTGAAILDGRLVVRLIDGFVPLPGDEFTILEAASVTGVFDAVDANSAYDVLYNPDSVVLQFVGPFLLGDLDGDGDVDIVDFLALLAAWGTCPATASCPADLNGDGDVGINDLLLLLANWTV